MSTFFCDLKMDPKKYNVTGHAAQSPVCTWACVSNCDHHTVSEAQELFSPALEDPDV